MATADRKRLLVVLRHSPYGASLSRSGLDAALAAAAFEQPVTLLFLGDGVLQLLPGQDGRAVGNKTLGRQLASLPLYDVEEVFADAAAVQRYAVDLETAPLPATAVDGDAMRRLLAECAHVLAF